MPKLKQLADAIRVLSMDAVQQANSGHPGMPMGMADIATVLWLKHMRCNPSNPNWFNRDRFVLSNGHGSMLQYALLHLSGFDLSMEQIKQFRQLHSQTPGHPEFGDTQGVETTTGPLGQGLANAVGMALAEKLLAQEFNQPEHPIVDHYTYAFAGDGCLMEGISHEVCSLAGTLGLGKLIVFYDDNDISIDGHVSGWFSDNTPERFRAYGWQVIADVDGHDHDAIDRAINSAHENALRPTLICCKTHIGFGSPNKVDTAAAHGAPLGADEIQATREALGWVEAPFEIPAEIYQHWDRRAQGQECESLWNVAFAQYESEFPAKAAEFLRRIQGYMPASFASESQDWIAQLQQTQKSNATRKSSLHCLDRFSLMLPELLGGSADLSGSNCTEWQGVQTVTHDDFTARYLKYGVREFGMAAIMNGIALHGGFIPFGGTFLVFSDYARNAVRLSALMKQKVIYVFTHDSIGLGEDGPTHQPIEHAASLRLMPGLNVWRPADSVETAVAWQHALQHAGPSALLLSRQNCPVYPRDESTLSQVAKGGYVVQDPEGECDAILIATGSELALAIDAAQQLADKSIQVRVVSMPCVKLFLSQDEAYQQSVLPDAVTARVAVEAGSTAAWYQFVGRKGRVVGVDQFGYSAPYEEVYAECGVTVSAVVESVLQLKETVAS